MDKLGETISLPLNWGTQVLSKMFRVAVYPIKHFLNQFNGPIMSVLYGAKYAARKMIIGFTLVVVILWVSILLYASFYHIYVPTATIMRPAHFKFRVCPSGIGMCSFPMANVTLGVDKKAEILGRGQQYHVILDMQVPDSIPNRDVGMFMVIIRMFDRYGAITQESSRAVSLRYQSDLLKTIQTFVLAPLFITGLIAGFSEEIQTLNIDMFDKFWDDFYRPSVGALVEVHSRQLMFYSAQLQFHASYGGLRYYLFHYPVTCALVGIVFNCLWLTPALLLPWYHYGLNIFNGERAGDDQDEMVGREDGGDDCGGEVPRRRGSGEGGAAADDDDDGAELFRDDDREVETVPESFHGDHAQPTVTTTTSTSITPQR